MRAMFFERMLVGINGDGVVDPTFDGIALQLKYVPQWFIENWSV